MKTPTFNYRIVLLILASTLVFSFTASMMYGQTPCGTLNQLDFSTDGNGNTLSRGTIVSNQFQTSYGITIQAVNNNSSHPDIAMIFDSQNPSGSDDDLGTPNQAYGGPGIGSGGVPSNYQNLGNLLIISEDGDPGDPDDESSGGEIRLGFANPTYIGALKLVDIDQNNSKVKVTFGTGQTQTINLSNTGDNSVQTVFVNQGNVTQITIDLTGSGGLANMSFCNSVSPLQLSITGSDSVCFGETTLLTTQVTGGTPPYSYSWVHGPVTPSVTVGGGNYQCQVTDILGSTALANFSVQSPFQAIAVQTSHSSYEGGLGISCAGRNDGWIDISMLGGFGGYSYTWSNGQTTQNISNLIQGTYSVTATDQFGCQDTASVTLTTPQPIALSTTTKDALCHGSATCGAEVLPTGGVGPYLYQWSNGDISNFITNVPAGTYNVIVRDVNNCDEIASVTLTEPTPIDIQMTGVQPECNQPGSIVAAVSGGTPGYGYAWSNGNQSSSISQAMPGTYALTVIDDNGCTQDESMVLLNPSGIAVTHSEVLPDCEGQNQGAINIEVTGMNGTPGFTWSNGATSQNLTGLASGTYTVTISDTTGSCPGQATFTLAAALEVNPLVNSVSCPEHHDGIINLNINGGSAPYMILWENGDSSLNRTGLSEGSYMVAVIDENGCQFRQNFELEATPAPQADAGADQSLVCAVSAELRANEPESGAIGYWTSLNQNAVIEDAGSAQTMITMPPGNTTHALWTVDRNGCFATDTVAILVEICSAYIPPQIPSGITPNGDASNQYFVVLNLPDNANLTVMNRWGNKVYEDSNYQNNWEGTNFNGEELAEGTYFVLLKYKDKLDQDAHLKGYVDIRRERN